jgi:hypothetical protein
MEYRKKPVVIEAMQFTGFIHGDLLPQDLAVFLEDAVLSYSKGGLQIHTLEGDEHIASIGDWIIKGVKGEFYPCKPDIFEATYELASKPNSEIASAVKDGKKELMEKIKAEMFRSVKTKQISQFKRVIENVEQSLRQEIEG